MRRLDTRAGVALPVLVACASVASYTAMDAVMKGLSIALGAYNATLWRTLAGTLMGALLFFGRSRSWPSRDALRLYPLRGATMTAMALLWFWGLARVPIAEAIALSFIAPIIAIFLASAWLGERVRPRALVGSLLGLAGVLIMLVARATGAYSAEVLPGVAAILAAGGLYAVNLVLMRQQAKGSPAVEMAFFQNLATSLFLALGAPVMADFPPVSQFPAILLAAALSFAALLLMSWAYAQAEAQSLVVVEYTGFAWGALFGWILFGEILGQWVMVGTLLIVGGCYLAVRPAPARIGIPLET